MGFCKEILLFWIKTRNMEYGCVVARRRKVPLLGSDHPQDAGKEVGVQSGVTNLGRAGKAGRLRQVVQNLTAQVTQASAFCPWVFC